MKDLTIKQAMLLEAIDYFINQNGYSPTIRELSSILNVDIKPVFEKLIVLENKGYITTVNGKARTIRVIKHIENDKV